ncbi:uncharacterized protein SEPMUDRAFT_64456, partial [Sphaerulina musiva SO2202]
MVSSVFAGLVAVAGIASALPQSTPTGSRSCEVIGSGNQDGQYTVTCGADRPGGDLSNGQAGSFEGCMPMCDQLAGCIGFAWVEGYGGGTCYFKSSLVDQINASNVDMAVKPDSSASSIASTSSIVSTSSVATSSSVAPTSSIASSTSASSTSVVASSTSVTPTSTAGSSCQQLASSGTTTDGYTIECGTDRSGGDLSAAPASSFSGCIPICKATAGCVGFSYVGGSNAGTCYLKSSITTASSNSNVDTAVMLSGGSSSSSSVASSTSSSSTSAVALSTSSSTSTIVPSTSSSSTSTAALS